MAAIPSQDVEECALCHRKMPGPGDLCSKCLDTFSPCRACDSRGEDDGPCTFCGRRSIRCWVDSVFICAVFVTLAAILVVVFLMENHGYMP